MRRKQKKTCANLNYIEHFLILASAVTRCISVSTFATLLGIPVGFARFAIGLNICTTAAGIKKYKSIIKKKKKKALIDSNNSHDEFVLINNVLEKI